jgi:hypothetical protein
MLNNVIAIGKSSAGLCRTAIADFWGTYLPRDVYWMYIIHTSYGVHTLIRRVQRYPCFNHGTVQVSPGDATVANRLRAGQPELLGPPSSTKLQWGQGVTSCG